MQHLPPPLAAMQGFKQFIAYRLEPSADKPGKSDKFPIDYRTGAMPPRGSGGAHYRGMWADFATVSTAVGYMGAGYGVGFAFSELDPFFFIDIDHCLQADGTWSATAQALLASFPGAAVEVSSSGTGLHIFGTGAAPAHGTKREDLGVEFYTEKRFAALTGTNIVGDIGTRHDASLAWLASSYFPPSTDSGGRAPEWTTEPVAEWRGSTDDDDLIRRALQSKSAAGAMGGRATFADLWEANVDALSKFFPSKGASPYGASEADRALAQHLAFWTGRNCERIERIMLQSALARPKWDRDNHAKYIELTILSAVAASRDVCKDKPLELPVGIPSEPVAVEAPDDIPSTIELAAMTLVEGTTMVSVEDQIELFKGCVYVTDVHRVLVPGGAMLKPEQFRVRYGGYTFVMDRNNEKVCRNAYEAFTESQAVRAPKADGTCFRPALPPAALVRDSGTVRVNTWWPVNVKRIKGDPTPFLKHLALVLPEPRDQKILLSYMAACVQHKGVKFQWCPFIQGVEGNGKTLFSRCVAEAVGKRYTHFPRADSITEKFNTWMFDKLFIGIEDIYTQDGRSEIIEILKPMITGEDLSKRAMQTDQVMADVCCNFILNSNHKDGVRKTRNDRRFSTMFCAQQEEEHLARDGLTGAYFADLYDWLKGNGRYAGTQGLGYGVVTELLHAYEIPDEFNPAGPICQRAPVTSSTHEAINASLGRIEQEIIEAIEQGLPGFANGWVSSIKLDQLLEQKRTAGRVPPNKRRDLMRSLGYDYHPALNDGRVNNAVLPDNGKPRLYVRKNHHSLHLTAPAEVSKAYAADQNIT